MRSGFFVVALASLFVSSLASAQQPPPPGYPPPPPYYAPPPGYPYPPPPPPPQQFQPPEELPYKEGAAIPVGYHVEERPRKGLVVSGWLLTLIPYGVGLIAAVSADFKNESGWLVVPFAGPWMTMGRRDYGCDDNKADEKDTGDGLTCVADVFVVMGLIMDGVMQTAGGTLLLIGYVNQKKHVVRDTATLRVSPMRIGTGRGLGVVGTF